MKLFLEKHKRCIPPAILFFVFGTVWFLFSQSMPPYVSASAAVANLVVRVLSFGSLVWFLLSIRSLTKTNRPAIGKLLLIGSLVISGFIALFTLFDLLLLLRI